MKKLLSLLNFFFRNKWDKRNSLWRWNFWTWN